MSGLSMAQTKALGALRDLGWQDITTARDVAKKLDPAAEHWQGTMQTLSSLVRRGLAAKSGTRPVRYWITAAGRDTLAGTK